jgi:hypothetical protein
MDNDGKWILGLLYRMFKQTSCQPFLTHNKWGRYQNQPFLQHFSNISPTSEVEQSGASLRAVITQFLPRRSTRFAQGGTGGTAPAWPRKGQGALRCQRCGEAVTVSWMQRSLSQIAWSIRTTAMDIFAMDISWSMLWMRNVGDVEWCLMMFNDV